MTWKVRNDTNFTLLFCQQNEQCHYQSIMCELLALQRTTFCPCGGCCNRNLPLSGQVPPAWMFVSAFVHNMEKCTWLNQKRFPTNCDSTVHSSFDNEVPNLLILKKMMHLITDCKDCTEWSHSKNFLHKEIGTKSIKTQRTLSLNNQLCFFMCTQHDNHFK